MSTHLFETYGMHLFEGEVFADDGLRQQVRELLAGMYPAGPFERRRSQRYPLPKLIQLQPVEADGATPKGPMLVASGKHISESGLSFFHPLPLQYRLIAASLEKADGQPARFLIDVDWCRCTQLGWYESGGRFVRPPVSAAGR